MDTPGLFVHHPSFSSDSLRLEWEAMCKRAISTREQPNTSWLTPRLTSLINDQSFKPWVVTIESPRAFLFMAWVTYSIRGGGNFPVIGSIMRMLFGTPLEDRVPWFRIIFPVYAACLRHMKTKGDALLGSCLKEVLLYDWVDTLFVWNVCVKMGYTSIGLHSFLSCVAIEKRRMRLLKAILAENGVMSTFDPVAIADTFTTEANRYVVYRRLGFMMSPQGILQAILKLRGARKINGVIKHNKRHVAELSAADANSILRHVQAHNDVPEGDGPLKWMPVHTTMKKLIKSGLRLGTFAAWSQALNGVYGVSLRSKPFSDLLCNGSILRIRGVTPSPLVQRPPDNDARPSTGLTAGLPASSSTVGASASLGTMLHVDASCLEDGGDVIFTMPENHQATGRANEGMQHVVGDNKRDRKEKNRELDGAVKKRQRVGKPKALQGTLVPPTEHASAIHFG